MLAERCFELGRQFFGVGGRCLADVALAEVGGWVSAQRLAVVQQRGWVTDLGGRAADEEEVGGVAGPHGVQQFSGFVGRGATVAGCWNRYSQFLLR